MTASDPDELLLATLNAQRPDLLAASQSSGAQAWLKSSLRTEDGTNELLLQLQSHIAKDSFLSQLKRDADHPVPLMPGGKRHEVLSKDWWSVTEADGIGPVCYSPHDCVPPQCGKRNQKRVCVHACSPNLLKLVTNMASGYLFKRFLTL